MSKPRDLLKNGITDRISFVSFSTGKEFQFPLFLTNFSDEYSSNWNSQEIYGRMDPIHTYKNTVRVINIAFDVPSFEIEEAKNNYENSKELVSGLYPVYDSTNALGARILAAPPLFRVKIANLMERKSETESEGEGLLGWIKGYSFKPELESGVFLEENKIIPKLFKVSFTFNVIHEHALGTDVKLCNLDKSPPPAKKGTRTIEKVLIRSSSAHDTKDNSGEITGRDVGIICRTRVESARPLFPDQDPNK